MENTRPLTVFSVCSAALSTTKIGFKVDVLELLPSNIRPYVTGLTDGTVYPLLCSAERVDMFLDRDFFNRVTLKPPLHVSIVLNVLLLGPFSRDNIPRILMPIHRLKPTRHIVSSERDSASRSNADKVRVSDTMLLDQVPSPSLKDLKVLALVVVFNIGGERTLLNSKLYATTVGSVSQYTKQLIEEHQCLRRAIAHPHSSKSISQASDT